MGEQGGVSRRDVLKLSGATGGLTAMAGCLGWITGGESSGGNDDETSDGDEEGQDSNEQPENAGDETNAGEETDPGGDTTENESENESEQPDAANPEPDPQGPETNESVINESRAGSEPSAEDVVISETNLVTDGNGATATGVATNESSEPVTIELRATFLKDGEQIGRPALNGTTGLPPGETWEFTISAMGSEYSEATNYELEKSVQVQG